MTAGHPDAFPLTRHSVVRAIASADPAARAQAYDAIVRSYWRPVYAYIRVRWRRDPADAQDLTQEFFARALEKHYLARYDASKARFRTFVRTCLDAFLSKDYEAAHRQKRGGGVRIESLVFARADADLAAPLRSDAGDPESWFRREWTRALFADAVERLRAECAAAGRPQAFDLFTRYDIDGPDAPVRPTYAALARDLGLPLTDVTNQLAWARRVFRAAVLDAIRAFCATDEEFRAEARDLLGVEAGERTLVASAFRRKAEAGDLPPQGGSHKI
jgi:RNA polymerase sigma factor (sigma-70 family)